MGPKYIRTALAFLGICIVLIEGAPAACCQPQRTGSDLQDRTKQERWIELSKDGIKQRLKDPDSANFKNVFFSTFEGKPIACGQVNSKNAFGGYGGYQRFIAAGKVIGILQEEMEPSEFAKSWNLMCVGR